MATHGLLDPREELNVQCNVSVNFRSDSKYEN